MIRNKKAIYAGVLDIPEGEDGEWKVKHDNRPAGEKFSLASDRTIMMGGDRPGSVIFDFPTRWHKLTENEGVWMTDLPIEQYQCDREIRPMQGKVLVGGLGLGYAVTALAHKRSVSRIVVVEKAPEVVRLVSGWLLLDSRAARNKVEFVTGDLFNYLKALPEENPTFDWAFYDIWQSDGEGTFHEVVCPLRRLSERRVRRVVAWNENVMRGQLFFGLESRLCMLNGIEKGTMKLEQFPTLEEFCTLAGTIWIDWSVPFFRWIRTLKERDPEKNPKIRERMGLYARFYGTTRWESVWLAITGMEDKS